MSPQMRWLLPVLALSMIFVGTYAVVAREPTADPAGSRTGTIIDIPAQAAGQPTLSEVAEAAGHTRIAINIMWTLVTGFLVMFMQAGFALWRRASRAQRTRLTRC